MTEFLRYVPLDDIRIRSGGDGRTVEAYAAIFNTETPITDQDGTYREVISPTAFTKTLAERAGKVGVFYNHARTLDGFPSDRFSMPLGKPLEIRADATGLYTVTRYNSTPLADEVLESIRNGDITGQSFSGRFIRSTPNVPRGGFRQQSDGSTPVVTRTEIALREYGPTPFPAYAGASIVGLRALIQELTQRTTPSEPDALVTSEVEADQATEPQSHSVRSLRDRIHAARVVRNI